MFSKRKNDGPGMKKALDTIIGAGSQCEGVIKIKNSALVHGLFRGEISCSDQLTITESAEVYAHLRGVDVYINGIVHGTLHAKKVQLGSQARFHGDIFATTLVVKEGAVFLGGSMAFDDDDAAGGAVV